jgi:hypothetical protein
VLCDLATPPCANPKVLIVGCGILASTGTAELYDPTAGTFTVTVFYTAARLASGQVLIVGGDYLPGGGQALRHAELYDPVSGLFTSTGGVHTERGGFTLTLLGSGGQVLVVGGTDSNATAEVYQ